MGGEQKANALRMAAEVIETFIPLYLIEAPRRSRAKRRACLNLSGRCLRLAVEELNKLADKCDA